MSDATPTTRTPAEIHLLRQGYYEALRSRPGGRWDSQKALRLSYQAYPMPQVERRRTWTSPSGGRYRVSEDGQQIEYLTPDCGWITSASDVPLIRALADLLAHPTEMVDADQVDNDE